MSNTGSWDRTLLDFFRWWVYFYALHTLYTLHTPHSARLFLFPRAPFLFTPLPLPLPLQPFTSTQILHSHSCVSVPTPHLRLPDHDGCNTLTFILGLFQHWLKTTLPHLACYFAHSLNGGGVWCWGHAIELALGVGVHQVWMISTSAGSSSHSVELAQPILGSKMGSRVLIYMRVCTRKSLFIYVKWL